LQPSRTCPVTYWHEYVEVFVAWNRFSDESLPDAYRLPVLGGWANQSPQFVECMDILKSVQHEMRQSKGGA